VIGWLVQVPVMLDVRTSIWKLGRGGERIVRDTDSVLREELGKYMMV
jgi:hypothetical protein